MINVLIFIGIGGYITWQKTKEAVTREFEKRSQDFTKFPNSEDFIYKSRKPYCVDAADYYGELVYARPADRGDRYGEMAVKLRKWISQANGIVSSEAERFKTTADLKVLCEKGEVVVLNVVLPLKSTDKLSKQPIVRALREKGLTNEHAKYIVYYDATFYGCGSNEAVCRGRCG